MQRPPGASTAWKQKYCLEDIQSHGPTVNIGDVFQADEQLDVRHFQTNVQEKV